jgi:hypothetical protein
LNHQAEDFAGFFAGNWNSYVPSIIRSGDHKRKFLRLLLPYLDSLLRMSEYHVKETGGSMWMVIPHLKLLPGNRRIYSDPVTDGKEKKCYKKDYQPKSPAWNSGLLGKAPLYHDVEPPGKTSGWFGEVGPTRLSLQLRRIVSPWSRPGQSQYAQ